MTNQFNGVKNQALAKWVSDTATLTQADAIHWCDGSEEEKHRLTREAIASQILISLNPAKRPGCYLHRSNPNDVARSEHLTFVCTPTRTAPVRPTTGRRPTKPTRNSARMASKGSMKGRTMYVVPYVMGPVGSPFAKVGVELTDSIYVALNMRIMTRMGRAALELLGESEDFNRGLHSHARPATRSAASSATSRRTTRFGRWAAATAATRFRARNVSRCELPATWAAPRVGWPSTCWFWGWKVAGGRNHLHCRRISERLRQDQPGNVVAAGALQGMACAYHRR